MMVIARWPLRSEPANSQCCARVPRSGSGSRLGCCRSAADRHPGRALVLSSCPALQAVVQVIEPLMFFNTQRLGVAPHLVELADQLDGLFGGLALAGNVQVDELVPGGGQVTCHRTFIQRLFASR